VEQAPIDIGLCPIKDISDVELRKDSAASLFGGGSGRQDVVKEGRNVLAGVGSPVTLGVAQDDIRDQGRRIPSTSDLDCLLG
jgi:hypothetical protein